MSKTADIVEEMEMAYEQIVEAVDALKQAARQAVSAGMIGETEQYRLERGALSYIKMALSNDHEFIGGNMHTVKDMMEAIRQLDREGGECPECGSELEQMGSGEDGGAYECPAGC